MRLIWTPAWWWRRDTATLGPTLEEAQKNLAAVGLTPTCEDPSDLVADKGYHSRDGLKALDGGPWKTRIAEPKPAKGYLRWHGDDEARAALVGGLSGPRSTPGPLADEAVLLANSGFILKPDFDRRRLGDAVDMSLQRAREVFLNPS